MKGSYVKVSPRRHTAEEEKEVLNVLSSSFVWMCVARLSLSLSLSPLNRRERTSTQHLDVVWICVGHTFLSVSVFFLIIANL